MMGRSFSVRRSLLALSFLGTALPTLLQAQPCGTPGRDGTGTLTGIVNTYYPGAATAAAGATSISVGSPSGAAAPIASGDLLLVIQMQDAAINSNNSSSYGDGVAGGNASGSTSLNNSGIYEFVVATGPVSGGSVSFLGGGNGGKLLNTYTNAAATGTQGQRRFQVIRVPQYSNVTLGSGLTALAWNGSVGGVLAIDVSQTLALGSATVSVDGKGFRGGGGRSMGGDGTANDYRCLATDNAHASKAEGVAGTPHYVYDGTSLLNTMAEGYPNGSNCQGAPGNAGGGGTDSGAVNDENSGGGGGGNGGAGGRGGNTWSSDLARGGYGGAAFAGSAARLALGGGGGAGVSNNAGPGHGAPGGGLILFRFNALSGTGTLTANGADAPDSTQDGAGGGGAGGTVLAAACTAGSLSGLTVRARGGAGGDAMWDAGDYHGPGGGGGGGRIYLSGSASSTSVTAGAHGNATTGNAYGSTSGSNGSSSTSATTASAPGARPGCVCRLTQALVSGFRAVPGDGGLTVEWRTSSEASTAGFYLFRREPSGAWTRVADRLLAPAVEAPQGGVYRLVDGAASPREPQTYSLLEVESGGRRLLHGPFRVRPDWSARLAPLAEPAVDGYARAARVPTPASAAARKSSGPKPPGAAASLQLWVRESGLYAVPAERIADGLGISPAAAADAVRAGRLTLATGGDTVAWTAGSDGSLLFYGRAPEGLYAAESVYWLTPGGSGKTMRTADGGHPAALASPTVFQETLHAEQDRFAGLAVVSDPEADYWFWQTLIAGDPAYQSGSFPLDVRGLAPGGAATLTVRLQGATTAHLAGEHQVEVRLNGALLGEVVWQEVQPGTATFAVDPSLLREGANTVDLTARTAPGVPFSIVYVQSFDLSYPRQARAEAGALLLSDPPGPVVTATGFASAAVAAYDVSEPKAPRVLAGGAVEPDGGGWRISVALPGRVRKLLLAGAGGAGAPRLEPWTAPASRLRDPANGADHLIVAPRSLAAAAGTLAAYRRSQGIDSRVVAVEQIYDEFNDGAPSPWAIQRFLAYAASSWRRRPAAVVLAGGGTYDYRDRLGLGGNLIPPLMVRATDGLYASDSRLGLEAGMVVGRLPVATAGQLADVVAKLIAYESGEPGPWRQDVLLVADDPDEGGQFDAGSDLAAGQVTAPYAATKLYLSPDLPADALRQQLLARLGGGAFLLNYLGHAALDRLAAESLLTSSDAALLANAPRLPVVAAMTCTVNRFEIPGFASLGGALVSNPRGGAVAVWAPSGTAWDAQSETLDRALLGPLLAPGTATVGDAVRAAAEGFRSAGGADDTLLLYNLLGDPATRLRKGG